MTRARMRLTLGVAGCAVTIAVAALQAARLDSLAPGITATLFADSNWSSAPVRTVLQPQPSVEQLHNSFIGPPPAVFSVTWTGSLMVPVGGRYVFSTESDDGSWLYLDGRLVVDNGGHHARRAARGEVDLTRGVHEIFIKYFQDGGADAFDLNWARGAKPLAEVPPWAFWSRHAEFSHVLARVVAWWALRLSALFLWIAILFAAVDVALATRRRWSAPLVGIVAASVLLNVTAITWGLPSAWIGDELTPTAVIRALATGYTHGWFDRYPPLHFYVLTFAYSPWLVLESIGWLRAQPSTETMALFVIGRSVTVVAAAGTLVAVYVCVSDVWGKRAGLFAAAILSLVTTFVFYAKAANPEVPYVFWFALSLVFYVRAIRTGARADVVGVFVAATAAICTKDQAYALYLSVPFVLAYRLGRTKGGWRTLAVGLASAMLVFAVVHDLPFNLPGFVSHVRDISGPGRAYRMFDATPGGEWSLLRLSIDLDRRSFGWPMFLVGLAGVLTAVRDRLERRFAVPLLLTGLTYYGAFVAVILYDYDRYLLPIAVLQAIFGGVAIDRFLAAGSGAAGRAAVAAVFAYSALYAASVDVLMTRDSRYAAERWLVERAPEGHLVATVFPATILPRMQNFDSVDIGTVENLRRWNPEYFVLNADYARALRPDSAPARLVAGLEDGTLGYRIAARFRAPSPWPWLPGAHPDLVGPRDEAPVASILRDVNPTIEVYDRDQSR